MFPLKQSMVNSGNVKNAEYSINELSNFHQAT